MRGNRRTRAYLDKLPDRARDRETTDRMVRENFAELFRLVSRPGILFAMKFQPPKQQPMLVTLASADDLKSEKVLLDPNAMDPRARRRSIGSCRRSMAKCGRLDFPRRK